MSNYDWRADLDYVAGTLFSVGGVKWMDANNRLAAYIEQLELLKDSAETFVGMLGYDLPDDFRKAVKGAR